MGVCDPEFLNQLFKIKEPYAEVFILCSLALLSYRNLPNSLFVYCSSLTSSTAYSKRKSIRVCQQNLV